MSLIKSLGASIVVFTTSLSLSAQTQYKKNVKDPVATPANLIYLEPEGMWLNNVNVNLGGAFVKAKVSGVSAVDVTNSRSGIEENLQYGLSSNTSISLTWAYTLQSENKFDYKFIVKPSDSSKSSGLQDPKIGMLWRFTEYGAGAGDLAFSYSPSIGKKKSETTSDNGNALRGGDSLQAAFLWTQKCGESSEAQIIALESYYLKSKGQDATVSTTETEDDAYLSSAVLARFQTELSTGLFSGASLFYANNAETVTTTTNPAVSKSKRGSYSSGAFALEGAWELNNKNVFKGALIYNLAFTVNSVDQNTLAQTELAYNNSTGLSLAWIHQF